MKKIKDFFYDKNDIIIVLIILAAAGFIIYTRIGAIMDYPEKLAKEVAKSEITEPADAADAADDTGEAPQTDTDDSGNVSISISDSDTSVSVAEKFEEAGLVSSATEFEGYITNMGKETSIKAGTFQIPSGSSEEDILNIITQ